jgi:RNA polymerase sigma-70 factor (ECF subfamily)
MPPKPGAWLTVTARNRAIDRIRRDATRAEKTKLLEAEEVMDEQVVEETLGGRSSYVLQAAIAALHTDDPLDWSEIAALYAEMNRAIAVAEPEGPAAGLALLERLNLDGYQYFHSTRAELLRRLDRPDDARAAFERALALARAEPERLFLLARIDEVGGTAGS